MPKENKLSLILKIKIKINRRVIFFPSTEKKIKNKKVRAEKLGVVETPAGIVVATYVCVRLALDEPTLSGAAICWRLRKLTSASDGGFVSLELVSVSSGVKKK